MGTAILRPNGSTVVAGAPSTNAASHHAAVSDNSDATYSRCPGNGSEVRFDFTTVAIPALAQVRQVQPRTRITSGSGHTGNVRLASAAGTFSDEQFSSGFGGTSDKTFTARTQTATGGGWSQAEIDSLQLTHVVYGLNSIDYLESYLDVLYNEAPTATVTGPAEGTTIINDSRPTITWTYSDPEGDAQQYYHPKVFTDAQYLAGGFDPETSEAFWDGGEIASSATSVEIGVDLPNDTYRAYIKVADSGSSKRWGLWDHNTFTINLTPPPVPVLTVTPQVLNANGPRVKLDVVQGGTVPATDFLVIEYSDDGVTWTPVRGANRIANVPSGTTFTVYDYEASPDGLRRYRAKAIRAL